MGDSSQPLIVRPANISRRGFLRSLGVTASVVGLGGLILPKAMPKFSDVWNPMGLTYTVYSRSPGVFVFTVYHADQNRIVCESIPYRSFT